ncbi:MAG: class I SAM-dependent methyltransferase [Myxococcota bacterium]
MSCDELELAEAGEVLGIAGPDCGGLLETLKIPCVPAARADRFLLIEADGQLELRPPEALDRPGIRADFPPERASRSARAHPLVRAFGRGTGRVLDLTAGLGADAYRLAAAGHHVEACERHAVVYALLQSGWSRAVARGRVPDAVVERLTFVHADALDRLASSTPGDLAVYLDPRYPAPRRASALPRRELQLLRRLLGGEGAEGAHLLAAARERASRVVVKRPTHAPPLAPGASFEVESKLVRFDVYVEAPRRGRASS